MSSEVKTEPTEMTSEGSPQMEVESGSSKDKEDEPKRFISLTRRLLSLISKILYKFVKLN